MIWAACTDHLHSSNNRIEIKEGIMPDHHTHVDIVF